MSEVAVHAVRTRRERKAFLNLPWQIYADDPLWVPPLRHDEAGLIGFRPHPFYDFAESQAFLATRNGDVCGRILAIHNPAHNEYQNDNRGFFGFFECQDDPHAATALFDAARQWLAERGLHNVRGPVNPSVNYTTGTLVDGFDLPPTFMLTYNPPYYDSLIQGYGFQKTQDLYAYRGHKDMAPAVVAKWGRVADQIIEHHGLTFRSMRRNCLHQDVSEFFDLFNRSLTDHWGMVPLSPGEVDSVIRGLSWLLVPEMAVGAEIDGKLVGVTFVVPDYNPRIRKINGRLFPFGFLRLVTRKHKIRKCRVVAANVLPEYRLLGIGLALTHMLREKFQDSDIEEVEFSWVAESNALSRGALEKGGAERTKTYRVYDLDA